MASPGDAAVGGDGRGSLRLLITPSNGGPPKLRSFRSGIMIKWEEMCRESCTRTDSSAGRRGDVPVSDGKRAA
eukprot:tig00000248_g21826.t1